MKDYELIANNNYKLILQLEEKEFDYYTDVYINLIFEGKTITLFNDNLLSLKNIFRQYDKDVDVLECCLDEKKLGILLNDYYRAQYEEEYNEKVILDDGERWIGEKYCLFMSKIYATWIYKYSGDVVMKVTPVFAGYEDDDYLQAYSLFEKNYKDVFRENITLEQFDFMKSVVFKLYSMLLKRNI